MSSRPVVSGAVGELLHVAGDAVVIVDDEGAVVAWSPGAATLFGISREDALAPGAAPLAEQLPALLTQPPDGTASRRAVAPYGVLEVRHRLVGPHHLLLLRDVSDEVRRSEGLRSLTRLSGQLLALDRPSLAAVLAAVAAEARAMTGAATSLVLLSRPGGPDQPSHFVCDGDGELFPDGPPPLRGLLATALSSGRPVRWTQLTGAAPDGLTLPAWHAAIGALCVVPLLAGAEVLGLLAVAGPAGARVFDGLDEELLVDLAGHAAVAVRWAQGAEREADRVRQRAEILSAARHDIRTPLGAGKGYSSLLLTRRDRMTPEQVQLALEGLQQAFERIEQMTEQLLRDEQLEGIGAEPQWAVVELAPMLEEVCRDAAVVTGRPDAVLLGYAADAQVRLAGDPRMVREVLDNLVGNALKHGGEQAPVMITVSSDDSRLRVEVRDEGPGIDAAEQGQLFERWTRTASTRGGGTQGFGLGLSIVKRLVAAHGGDVGVDSAAGAGATFWVTLPIERRRL